MKKNQTAKHFLLFAALLLHPHVEAGETLAGERCNDMGDFCRRAGDRQHDLAGEPLRLNDAAVPRAPEADQESDHGPDVRAFHRRSHSHPIRSVAPGTWGNVKRLND